MREGWEIRKLIEIGKVQTGTTPSTKEPKNYGDYIPFVKPAHFKPNGEIDSGESMLSEEGLKNGRYFDANSILMVCIGATIGKVGYTTIPVSSNQQINALTPNKDIDCKFIYYGMTSSIFQKKILEEGKSAQATLPIINKSKWQNLEIPIPPLSEQKQIVALLDKAFAAIDQAKANIEQNIQNAKELFQSKLNAIFSSSNPESFKTTIGEQLTLQRGFDITKKEQIPGNVPVVSSGGIKSFHNKAMVNAPGVVIGRKGTLGKVYFLKKDFWPHDTTLWIKNFYGNRPEIAYYLFKWFKVKKFDSGSANPALNRNQVHPIEVFWPKLKSQAQTIEQLSVFELKSSEVIDLYLKKFQSLEELKKSILQKAFAGELTSTSLAKTAKDITV